MALDLCSIIFLSSFTMNDIIDLYGKAIPITGGILTVHPYYSLVSYNR